MRRLAAVAGQIALGVIAIGIGAVGSAHARPHVTGVAIDVRPAGGGVEVSYTLSKPATSLALSNDASLPHDARIRSSDPAVLLAGGKLIAQRAVSRFVLRIEPDQAEADATYPLLRSISGTTFLIYLPYLATTAPVARITLWSKDGTRKAVPVASATMGYALVDAAPVSVGLADFVFSADTPGMLRTEMTARTQTILAYYSRRMGWSPRARPTVVVKFVDTSARPGRWYNRGDATGNGVIFLRVGAKGADLNNATFRSDYTHFLAHELFHIWNGAIVGDSADWWLLEGGAEYSAWLAANSSWPDEIKLERKVQSALGGCATALGPAALRALTAEQARGARYPCGAVIQWLEDIRLRSVVGRSDAFTMWRAILPRREPHRYSTANFDALVRRLGGGRNDAIQSIMTSSNDNRWSLVAATARQAGAAVDVQPPSPFSLRLAAAKALMQSACGALDGVGEDARGLYAITPDSCALLGGDVVILSAEGIDPMKDPNGFYRAIERSCWSGAAIALVATRNSEGVRTRVQCTVAVDPPAPTFVVSRALPERSKSARNLVPMPPTSPNGDGSRSAP